jgi:hypothetical protein
MATELRRCEPQHDHAVKAIADKLVEKIDEGFLVEPRAPRDPSSAAHLYVGWKPPDGERLPRHLRDQKP